MLHRQSVPSRQYPNRVRPTGGPLRRLHRARLDVPVGRGDRRRVQTGVDVRRDDLPHGLLRCERHLQTGERELGLRSGWGGVRSVSVRPGLRRGSTMHGALQPGYLSDGLLHVDEHHVSGNVSARHRRRRVRHSRIALPRLLQVRPPMPHRHRRPRPRRQPRSGLRPHCNGLRLPLRLLRPERPVSTGDLGRPLRHGRFCVSGLHALRHSMRGTVLFGSARCRRMQREHLPDGVLRQRRRVPAGPDEFGVRRRRRELCQLLVDVHGLLEPAVCDPS